MGSGVSPRGVSPRGGCWQVSACWRFFRTRGVKNTLLCISNDCWPAIITIIRVGRWGKRGVEKKSGNGGEIINREKKFTVVLKSCQVTNSSSEEP